MTRVKKGSVEGPSEENDGAPDVRETCDGRQILSAVLGGGFEEPEDLRVEEGGRVEGTRVRVSRR